MNIFQNPKINKCVANKGSVTLFISSVLFCFASTPILAKELKLASPIPPQHPLQARVLNPTVKAFAGKTGGTTTIKIYPGGALGKGFPQQYKRAVQGVADISFVILAFNTNIFPKTNLINQTGKAKNAIDATERLWSAYDAHLADEYKDVKMLGLWTVSQAVLISRGKKIRKMSDLKGVKIMTPGADFAPLVRSWGASPVSLNLSEMYNAVSTGTVDMVAIAASALIKPWNLMEVANSVSSGLTGLISPLALVMNKKSWNGLSTSDKSALDGVTGKGMSMKAARVFDGIGKFAMKGAQKNPKIEVINLDPSVREALSKAATPVANKIIASLEKKGIKDARAAYQAINK